MNAKLHLERVLFISVRYSAVLLPLIILAGIFLGGAWSFAGVGVIFGYYFMVELILWAVGLGVDLTPADEFRYTDPENPTWMDLNGVALFGIMYLFTVPTVIILLARDSTSTLEIIGGIASLTVMASSVGGLAGHEYVHRRERWPRALGVGIYGVMNYAHFAVSHLYGHHRNVGLHNDWSTARHNETAFAFMWRAIVHGYIGAWKLEAQRRKRRKLKVLSLDNFMVKATLAQILLTAVFALGFGIRAAVIFWVVSLTSACVMEMVNYLSHYALTRKVNADGSVEPIADKHSWESANKVTNWFIFNAGKHCHHHRRAAEEQHLLELSNAKTYLPFGLPLMTLIAFCPPLYFAIMNPMKAALAD